MNYGYLVSRAWQMTFRHRFLWGLGILAACTMGGGMNFNPFPPRPQAQQMHNIWRQVRQQAMVYVNSRLTLVELIAAGLVLLSLVWFIYSLLAKAGLIVSVENLEKKQPVSFREALAAARYWFWRLLGLYFLLLLASLMVWAIFLAPALLFFYAGNDLAARYAAAIAVWVLMIPLYYLGLLYTLADRFIVLGDLGIREALCRAQALIMSRKLDAFLTWLLNLGLRMGWVIALMLPFTVVMILLVMGMMVSGPAQAMKVVWIVAAVLAPIIIFWQALFGAFDSSYWTLAYLALTKPKEQIAEAPLPAPAI
jgi:hypothetical protein